MKVNFTNEGGAQMLSLKSNGHALDVHVNDKGVLWFYDGALLEEMEMDLLTSLKEEGRGLCLMPKGYKEEQTTYPASDVIPMIGITGFVDRVVLMFITEGKLKVMHMCRGYCTSYTEYYNDSTDLTDLLCA